MEISRFIQLLKINFWKILYISTVGLIKNLDGSWTIVDGLDVSSFSREKLDATAAELGEEKAFALDFLKIAA